MQIHRNHHNCEKSVSFLIKHSNLPRLTLTAEIFLTDQLMGQVWKEPSKTRRSRFESNTHQD